MPTLPPGTRPRHSARPSRLAVYAAPKLGMRPGSVEQLIPGHSPLHERFATLVAAALEVGDANMVARLMAPIQAVLAGSPAGV